jgi:hypothetical protein
MGWLEDTFDLNKLDAIAEWIFGEGATDTRDRGVLGDLASCHDQCRRQSAKLSDTKCGMRFLGRQELFLHAQVKLQLAALKPSTAAARKFGRLRKLEQAKQLDVERSRLFFATGRHGELHVV